MVLSFGRGASSGRRGCRGTGAGARSAQRVTRPAPSVAQAVAQPVAQPEACPGSQIFLLEIDQPHQPLEITALTWFGWLWALAAQIHVHAIDVASMKRNGHLLKIAPEKGSS